MLTSKVYCFSTASSYASLTLGVMQSTAGVTVSLAAMLAFKLWPTLLPCAPELRRTTTPICSQRRPQRSSVDTVVSDTSGFTYDFASTLVEPDVKRERRLSAAFTRKPFTRIAKTTKKDSMRPLTRRMSDSFSAVAAPFTISTTSLFSPASESYLPRVISMSVKAVAKNAKCNSANMMLFGRKTVFPSSSGDIAVPSPLVSKLCSLVPEECDFLEEFTPSAKDSPLKKTFRAGGKISREVSL